MGYVFYGVLLLIVGVSLRRPVGALAEARRQRANLRKELRALAEGTYTATTLEHLSPPLARLVEETRVLRLALEEPLQAVRAWLASDRSPWLARVDMSDGSDLDRAAEVDVALVNARRAVWDWLAALDELPERDRELLVDLGLSAGTVRASLEARDGFRRISTLPRQESARIEQMIAPLRTALERYEATLSAGTRAGPYR